MNLGQLRHAVRRRASVPQTDGMWTDTYVNEAVNEALSQIGSEHPWPWLQTTTELAHTNGTLTLSAVSPNVREIAHLFIGTVEAEPASVADTTRTYSDQGRYIYSTWGDTLQITPAPATADLVTIRFYQLEPELTDDTDIPVLPAAYHPVIVHRACSIGFEGLEDQQSAAIHEARARSLIERMERTALRRSRGPHRIRIRPGHQF